MPRWKKLAIAGGVAMFVIAGVCLAAEGGSPGPELSKGTGGVGELSTSLVGNKPGQPGATASPTGTGDIAWSEAFFRYGFSFFIGFGVGYAVRAFLKLTMLFVGLVALAIFLLQYGGFVTVQWDALDKSFETLMSSAKQQLSAFRSFITGSLPNAGLGALGLYAGFRKS